MVLARSVVDFCHLSTTAVYGRNVVDQSAENDENPAPGHCQSKESKAISSASRSTGSCPGGSVIGYDTHCQLDLVEADSCRFVSPAKISPDPDFHPCFAGCVTLLCHADGH